MAVIGEIHRDPSARPRSSVPLISLGQGDFRRDFFPEDFGMSTENHTPAPATTDSKLLEAEVLGAALRYVAVADWFEHLPYSHREQERDRRAMDTFNRVEAELRQVGGRLLRRLGHRQLVLERVLEEVAAS